MKRILLAVLLFSLLLFLVSCDLFGGRPTAGPGGDGTTAPPPTTTAPSQSDPALPSFSALSTAMKTETPTRSEVTLLSVYTDPDVTLSADLLFLHTEGSDRYEYRIDYLLPIEEALAAGSPIGERCGYLTLSGSTITEASSEINNEVLEEMQSLSLRKPSLHEEFFTRCTIKSEGGAILLSGEVKDYAVPLLFDPHTEGITDLSLTVTFTAGGERPTEVLLSFTARDGARTTYRAVYSYDPVTIPKG